MYHYQTSLNCGIPSLTEKNSIKQWQENSTTSVIVVLGEGWAGMCSRDSYALSVGDRQPVLYNRTAAVFGRLGKTCTDGIRAHNGESHQQATAGANHSRHSLFNATHFSCWPRLYILYVYPISLMCISFKGFTPFIRFVYLSSIQLSDKVYFQCKYT